VLRAEGSDRLGVFAAGLTLWDPQTRVTRRIDLEGRIPTALFEGAGGALLVATEGARDHLPQIGRVDAGGTRLIPIPTPSVKDGRLVAAPGGAWIVLFEPGAQPPAMLHALDRASGAWSDVDNPGLNGWEPLAPR
jgi:hypothetical protein